MAGVTLGRHHPADVHHLLGVAEAEAVVSAGAAATVDLGLHQREIGLLSVLIGQGVRVLIGRGARLLIGQGAPSKVGVQSDRRALQYHREAESALPPPRRENQGAEAAPLLGMLDVPMVPIMVGVLGQGAEAEAPWMNPRERALGMEMPEAEAHTR